MSVPPADCAWFAPIKFVRFCSLLLALACLAACASHRGGGSGGGGQNASRGAYKVGAPYTIDGVTYVPQEEFNHVETGVASWYGPGFHGKSTANGETYDQQDHTAAHRTLQMPSIVRVTNLDNGHSTVVRVNDRGPYARSRVIDLSRAAAQDLDLIRNGTAHVRIDQLTAESLAVKDIALSGGTANEQREVVAHAGSYGSPSPGAYRQPPVMVAASYPPTERAAALPTPQGPGPTIASLASAAPPSGQTMPGPPPFRSGSPQAPPPSVFSNAGGGFYVQAGSFSTISNAERQRGMISSYGTVEIASGSAGGREVYRVRLGPYTTPDAAGIVADRLKRSGYGDARVVSD
jgi:rare lipoprotein A